MPTLLGPTHIVLTWALVDLSTAPGTVTAALPGKACLSPLGILGACKAPKPKAALNKRREGGEKRERRKKLAR